ncbi:transcriptional coactivator p15/PC4 family protein [Thermoproteota archaeon]
MQKVIKAFEKNKFQEIRVGISEYQGNDLIDIRTWTLPKGAEEKIPTSKGVSINVKLYPELKEAVLALEQELKDANLIEK